MSGKHSSGEYNWTDISPLHRFLNLMNEFGHPKIFILTTMPTSNALATDEEAAVINTYMTDLTTYLNEMTTSYITGIKTTDTYEEDLQYAYDNLGMQEYADVIQARIDRYLVVLGREPILG